MKTYIYTSDKTPFSTCTRAIGKKTVYRCKSNAVSRRYIRRHNISAHTAQ